MIYKQKKWKNNKNKKEKKKQKQLRGEKKKKEEGRIKHKTLASKWFFWILFRVKDLGFRVAEFEIHHSMDVCMYHTCSVVSALCIECSLSKMLCFVFKRVDASTQRQANNMTWFVQYCCTMASTLQEWQEEFQKPSYSSMVYMALRYCLHSLWFRVIEFCFIIVTWIEPSDWAALSPMWYTQCDIFKGFMIN